MKVIGVAREICEMKDDDGELEFYDIRYGDEKRKLNLDTVIGRIRIIVKDWKKYLAPLMETLVLEAAYKHAELGKKNVTSFKAAAELIMPKERADDGDKITVPPRVAAILQSNPVDTTIIIGKGNGAERTGHQGYERTDTVHPMADGQREDTPVGTLSPEHDTVVYGLSEGEDTTEGSSVPDTTVSLEDSVDNDSRDDMGSD
jgi:hypothetical protein